jgi:hypothetical protein
MSAWKIPAILLTAQCVRIDLMHARERDELVGCDLVVKSFREQPNHEIAFEGLRVTALICPEQIVLSRGGEPLRWALVPMDLYEQACATAPQPALPEPAEPLEAKP